MIHSFLWHAKVHNPVRMASTLHSRRQDTKLAVLSVAEARVRLTFYSFAIGLVAFLHVVFFFLEAVLWTSPMVTRLFQMSRDDAETTRVLALNQGIYNLGVAVLLIWFAMGDNMAAVMGLHHLYRSWELWAH